MDDYHKVSIVFLLAGSIFYSLVHPILIMPFVGLSLFNVIFNRDPERNTPEGEVVVSPADGKIVEIKEIEKGEVFYGHALDESYIRVGIFMSIFDVHMNRVPLSGFVEEIKHIKGRFSPLIFREPSENEKNLIWIRDGNGSVYCVVQIAGFLARRIKCWVREGHYLKTGDRLGKITFGSRVDLILPKSDWKIKVSLREKVRAGETVLFERCRESEDN